MTLKVDHTFSPTRSFAVSYFFLNGTDMQPLSTPPANIPWVDRDFAWKQQNLNVADTWILSATKINQLRVTYVRQFGARVNNPTTSLGDLGSKFQIQGDPSLPRITVTGYFTGQTSIAGPDAGSDFFAVKDSITMTRGNHSLKFGGEVSYEKIVHDTLLDNYGVFQFNSSKTGNAYADFLLGLPSTFTQDAPIRKIDSGTYFSVFAQDDFRIHPRVTLNLGVRYDLQQPLTDPQDRKLAFVPGSKSQVSPGAPEGLLFPGDEGISRGIVSGIATTSRRASAWRGILEATDACPCVQAPVFSTAASPGMSGTRRPIISRSPCASNFRPCSRCPTHTATSPAAWARSRSNTTRRARGSPTPLKSSGLPSNSSGRRPIR